MHELKKLSFRAGQSLSLAAGVGLENGNGYCSLGSTLQAERKLPEARVDDQQALNLA